VTRHPPRGIATTDLVVSSHMGDNAPVFADILRLHVPEGSVVADVTWGKGAFWRHVPDGAYKVFGTDIQTGVDCRALPYDSDTIDAVVLDPPYMEGLFRRPGTAMAGAGTHAPFRSSYSDSQAQEDGPKYHEAVLDLYLRAADEAWRALRNFGILIVKCQDEVSANRQRLTHVELINAWAERFYCKDLFVVTRRNKPGVSRMIRQEHARKSHSYFLVLIKRDPAHPNRLRPPRAARSEAA
jgi:hypothetical protein